MTPAAPASQGERVGAAIALVICAGLIFSLSDSAAKQVVASLDPVQAFWTRSLVVVALTLPVVLRRRGVGVLMAKRPKLQIARGLLVFGASILFLTGLRSLALADATAINFVWPVLITILAIPLLGETVGFRRAAATIAGFIGMLIIMRPGSSSFQTAALFPFCGAFCWATASVITRLLSRDDPPETTIVWSALATLAASTAVLPFFWSVPTLNELALCAIVGVGSAASHAMIVVAYGRAPASALAPYAYAQLVFAAGCGYAFFGTLPDRWVILGAVVIAASGLYTIHRERVRRLERQAG